MSNSVSRCVSRFRRVFPATHIMLVLTTVAPCGLLVAQERQDAQLEGRWTGTGTFFDRQLAMRVGAIPIALTFDDKASGSGAIGAATLEGMQVRVRGKDVQVTARLVGAVHTDPSLDKKHVVFIVTAISDTTVNAEFHLKSNGIFDPRMREGSVVLRRARAR